MVVKLKQFQIDEVTVIFAFSMEGLGKRGGGGGGGGDISTT